MAEEDPEESPQEAPATEENTEGADTENNSDQADQGSEDTKAQEEPSQEPADPEDPPQWIQDKKVQQIISLVFNETTLTPDVYEQALIWLYKKKINIRTMFLLHFFGISLIFWPPFFRYKEYLSAGDKALRWFVIFFIPCFASFVIYSILSGSPYQEHTLPILLLLLSSLFTVHTLIAFDTFRPWFRAYNSLKKNILPQYKPKKKKKKRKKRKKKTEETKETKETKK